MKDYIDRRAFLTLLVLTLLWGLNYIAVKISNEGLSPVFTTFLRSSIASFCGILYCLFLKKTLFHRNILLLHGLAVGILFGVEFVCLYLGLLYTDASRAVILVYLSPFVVSIGAHIFLKEKLTFYKFLGLILAFFGLYLVFAGKPKTYSEKMLLGDLLEIAAAIFWGATTIYIKKYLAEKVHPINTFLYQLVFSIPIMFVFAVFLEKSWIKDLNGLVLTSLLFQSIIVAFASYFLWFKLIHNYPVGRLSSFTFLTPVFGVIFGVLFLKERASLALFFSLFLVSLGIYCTNAEAPFSFLRTFKKKLHSFGKILYF